MKKKQQEQVYVVYLRDENLKAASEPESNNEINTWEENCTEKINLDQNKYKIQNKIKLYNKIYMCGSFNDYS